MRLRLALCFALSLVGCGGVVDEGADGAMAGAGARGGEGGRPLGPDTRPPLEATAGQVSLVGDPLEGQGGATDVGDDPDGVDVSLAGTDNAPDPSAVTSRVVEQPPMPRGFLSAAQYTRGGDGAAVYSIEAIFETTRGQWDGCTQVRLGECWYYDCPPGSAPYLPSVPLQSAGAVSVTTASEPVSTVQVGLLYDFWYQADGSGELWSAFGTGLAFSATGETVPPFWLAVQSPPTVTLVTLNGEPSPKSIARGEGAALRWTSTGPGIAYFLLYGFYDSKFAAECEFDASAGAGELPSVLLQQLSPGPDYYASFYGLSRAHKNVKGWQFDASLAGYGGAGYPFDGQKTELR